MLAGDVGGTRIGEKRAEEGRGKYISLLRKYCVLSFLCWEDYRTRKGFQVQNYNLTKIIIMNETFNQVIIGNGMSIKFLCAFPTYRATTK